MDLLWGMLVKEDLKCVKLGSFPHIMAQSHVDVKGRIVQNSEMRWKASEWRLNEGGVIKE